MNNKDLILRYRWIFPYQSKLKYKSIRWEKIYLMPLGGFWHYWDGNVYHQYIFYITDFIYFLYFKKNIFTEITTILNTISKAFNSPLMKFILFFVLIKLIVLILNCFFLFEKSPIYEIEIPKINCPKVKDKRTVTTMISAIKCNNRSFCLFIRSLTIFGNYNDFPVDSLLNSSSHKIST